MRVKRALDLSHDRPCGPVFGLHQRQLADADAMFARDGAAKAQGARSAAMILLRLAGEVRDIFREWLLRHYPDRYRHVMSLVRSMRDGKDYDSEWGKRMKGSGPYAWQIGRRFEIAAKKLGLNAERRVLRTDLFKATEKANDQLMLL